jgi:hypothetical protein
MARKLTGGLVGQPSVGAINVAPTAVVTAAENQDITLSPIGSGSVIVTNNVQLNAQNDLRFADSDSSNYVAFQAPATIASNITWTLPNTDGSSGQFLSTNASGTLSWASGSLSLSDNTTDSATHYLTLTTATSGAVTAARISSTKLSFQPSTGTLTCTALSAGTITETSSIVLKENFRPIENALEKILQLNGLIYDRKDGTQRDEVGLIAEDVNKIIPNVVGKDDNNNPMTIAYQRIVAYLIESIKDLNNEIEQIKKGR